MPGENLYAGLHHVSLLVTDLDRAADFYINLLGLEKDALRPDMVFPGMWLKLGNQQIHLLSLGDKSSGTGAEHPGRDSHFALLVTSVSRIEEILIREAIPYHLSKSGRQALFCRDPDGNGIEFVEIARG